MFLFNKKGCNVRELVNQEIKLIIVPELRKYRFTGSFPHFRRIYQNGKVDYLSFQFNRYGGSFIIELAVAYPYKGKYGNFYYDGEITPEFLKKSNYGYTNKRLRLTPDNSEWFEFSDKSYKKTVADALDKIINNINYFEIESVE